MGSPIESETTISLPDVDFEEVKNFLEDIHGKKRRIVVWKGVNNILGHQLKCDMFVHDTRTIEYEDFEDIFDADVDNDDFEIDNVTKISFTKNTSTTQLNVNDESIDSGETVPKKVTIPITKRKRIRKRKKK